MSLTPPEDEIYVTLPSNVCHEIYPENKPANYKTRLNIALELPGEWEVALIDIQYPHFWPNILKDTRLYVRLTPPEKRLTGEEKQTWYRMRQEGKNSSALTFDNLLELMKFEFMLRPEAKRGVFFPIDIPANFYKSAESLMKHIVNMANTSKHNKDGVRITYKYEPISREMEIGTSPAGATATFVTDSPYIFEKMGFPLKYFEQFKTIPLHSYPCHKLRTSSPPSFDDISAIYVYSDLIKYQMVGDTKAPLMGVFPVQGEHGKQLYWNFNPPYYIPVAKSYIPDVEIQLSTEKGSHVPFTEGDVVCRLHFRRKLFT